MGFLGLPLRIFSSRVSLRIYTKCLSSPSKLISYYHPQACILIRLLHILTPCSQVHTPQRTMDDLLKTMEHHLQRLEQDELLQVAKCPRRLPRVALLCPQFCSLLHKAISRIPVLKNSDRLTCVNY